MRAPARAIAALDWQLISTIDEFERLRPEWAALQQQMPDVSRVFADFDWNWHWCRHYLGARGGQLAVVVGRHAGAVVTIWPLVRQRLAQRITVG